MKILTTLLLGLCWAISVPTHAATVGLQNATATFSQTYVGDFSVGRAINGTTADGLGWSMYPQTGQNQTAAFETSANVGFAGGSFLTFTINQAYAAWGAHMLGRFRLSVTTDDRSRCVFLTVNVLWMFGSAHDAVNESVAGFNDNLTHVPRERA